MPAAVIELNEAVCDALDERLPFEDVGIAALRRQAVGLPEGRTKIANHVPVLRAFAGLFHFIENVVLVLDVRAVEHHQDDQQPLVGTHAHERVLLPRPAVDGLDGFLRQTKTAARLDMRSLVVFDGERWEKVDGRLVVANCREYARQSHFDRAFRALSVVRRLFDVPLAARRICDSYARIRALLLSLYEGIDHVRVRLPIATPRS